MEQDDLGGCFVVSVEELGHNGLWSSIKDFLESRALLQNVLLSNKVGQEVLVDNLPVQYVLSSDKRLLRLKPFSHSPVTWFRNPYAHVILVSTAEANDYKATVKNMMSKVVADLEREWGGATLTCEWIILYVRPFELDVNDRNAKRVFEKLRDDFGRKKRERCVRLDVPSKMFDPLGRRMPALGLEDFELCLKEAIQASFESRQSAYDDEVKKLVEERLEPAWSFTTLYLVKDSFALMLDCAGLFEDALKEYMELELCYLEALQRRAVVSPDFGANSENDDMAQILTASWRTTRRAVLKKNGIPEFSFRQYLFAAQARLLLKLGRLLEVGERGLFFINSMMDLLAEKQQQGVVRPYLRETWAFSACLVLVAIISASLSQPEPAQEELASYLDAARTGSMVGGRPGSRPSSQSQLPALRPPSMIGTNSAAAASPAKSDWDLGLSGSDTQSHNDMPVMGGKALLPALFSNFSRSSQAMEAQHRDVMEKMLYRLLGHMYLLARQQLLSLGQAVHFAGPLDPRPDTNLPSSLQGLLDPSFGTLLSLTASYHARSSISVDHVMTSQPSMMTPRSAFDSPRSEARSEVSSFAPGTPDPASRHPHTNAPSASPAPASGTLHHPPAAATPERASPFTAQATPPPPTPRSAAAGTIADSSPAMSPAPSATHTANGDVAAAGLVLRSVSEWRLRAALERQDSFDDLVQSLTSLTAWCFARANHGRSAALVSLEQAAILIRHGALEAGCHALESTVGKLEGWGVLHGYLLPHLLAAQTECKHPSLPHSLTTLLTLPPAFMLSRSRSMFTRHLQSALDDVAVSLDMSASQWRQQQFLTAYTVSNTFSRLCGVHDDSDPLLVPPPRPPQYGAPPAPEGTRVRGACKVCAGDKSYVWLDLHNSLDEMLELTSVVLVLGLLQPISPTSRGSGVYRQSSGSIRLTTGWQDAQDVICHQVTEAPADGQLPPATAWLQSEPSTVKLRPGRTRLVAATVPTHDGLYTLKYVTASLKGMKLHIHVQQAPEQLVGRGARREQDVPAFLRSVIPAVDPSNNSHIWGIANKDGDVGEELVGLAVEAVCRRVECRLAAVGGRLVGGVNPQWLGLLILPRHDSLHHLVVRLGTRLTSESGKDRKGELTMSSTGALTDVSKGGVELFSGLQRALLVDLNKFAEHLKGEDSVNSYSTDSIQCGTWVSAARGTVDLGQMALEGPALLWMQAGAGCPAQEVEVVKVQRSAPSEPSGRHTGLFSDQQSESRRSDRLCSISMDVSLEYMCGCPRAHTCVLNMPLHPPFHVQLVPTLISTTTTALQVVLQCGLLRGVVITGLDLAPQVGLQVTSHAGAVAALLPLRLDPSATASITLLLQSGITEELPAEQYKDQASVLSVTYTIEGESHVEVPTEVVPGPIPAGHTCWEHPLPRPPSTSPTDDSTAHMPEGLSCSGQEQVFQHAFVLEFPAGQAVESDLQVQLLGPWSGRVGEPVAMSWQVTRLSPGNRAQLGSSGGPDEMIYFEVNQDNSNWYSVCQGQGMLRLGRQVGATATVEAVVVPQQAGSCPPPGLNLRGVSVSASDAYSQEIFIHAA